MSAELIKAVIDSNDSVIVSFRTVIADSVNQNVVGDLTQAISVTATINEDLVSSAFKNGT